MQVIRVRVLALAAVVGLAPVAWAQSQDAKTQGGQAQDDRAATAGARDAHADSSGSQQEAGKTAPAPPSKPARTDQAATSGDDFDTLDTDHDGRISRAEAGASQDFGGRFKTLDADGDGYVSGAEYREGLRATRTPATRP